MITILRILAAAGIAWSIVALAAQVRAAWGGGRRDHSRPAGDPRRGIRYAFTTAMLPSRKEAIRLHPVEFAVGLLMHAGVAIALTGVVLLIVRPAAGLALLSFAWPVLVVALGAAATLLVRRARAPNLRAMSVPDDYLAITATGGLLAAAALAPLGAPATFALLLYAVLFFFYLPLGKLRHAVFFFVARGDYGRRLGYRGVYPPSTGMEPGR